MEKKIYTKEAKLIKDSLKCDICDFSAVSQNTIRKHINTKHPDIKSEGT